LLQALARLKADERSTISAISAKIRTTIESITVPEDITAEIVVFLARLGEEEAYVLSISGKFIIGFGNDAEFSLWSRGSEGRLLD
jgi:phosphoenolpyruvate synthase/pyruvate phosphate dikinase